MLRARFRIYKAESYGSRPAARLGRTAAAGVERIESTQLGCGLCRSPFSEWLGESVGHSQPPAFPSGSGLFFTSRLTLFAGEVGKKTAGSVYYVVRSGAGNKCASPDVCAGRVETPPRRWTHPQPRAMLQAKHFRFPLPSPQIYPSRPSPATVVRPGSTRSAARAC